LAIRIYALAKELQIDNKKLVDICTRAGITGKGSALASLSDEEVVRLKEFMAGGQRAAGGKAGTARAPDTPATGGSIRRQDYIPPAGTGTGSKVPVLKPDKPVARKKPEETAPPAVTAEAVSPAAPKSPSAPATRVEPTTPAESISPAPAVSPAPALTTPAAPSTAAVSPTTGSTASPSLPSIAASTSAPAKPAAKDTTLPAKPTPPPETPRPAIGPVRSTMARTGPSTSRPLERLLGNRSQENKSADKKPGEKKPGDKPATAIHLAPMPAPSKTLGKGKPKEPAPQKPDIKLPPDAIRAGKAGSGPLSAQLRKHEEKKKRDDLAAKKGPARPGAPTVAPGALPLEPLGGKDRPRRVPVKPVAAGEEERDGAGLATLGGREQRQAKRKRSTTVKRRVGEEEDSSASGSSRRTHIHRRGTNTAAPRKGKVIIELPCTVRSFAEATGEPKAKILGKLLSLGIMSNIAASLDADTAELLAAELGVDAEIRREVSLEQKVLGSAEQADPPESLKPRPPIVTFLGHVDHGKTSLLDRIIGLDVAAHEKGGITQYIRAYKVDKGGRAVTFVDTPGHEAFTEMRARGANVTDIAVLVVAADDGIMPQTEEAISHARAADVPIVVALNKIDLPGINIERLYTQLSENQLQPSEWGGETEVVKTSATKGTGMDELLETLLTVAELHEYKANPDRPAQGTCLEAEMHEERGVIAKLIVQNGTLRPGDIVVCGGAFGRVKAMYDTLNPHKKYDEAGPSMPVNVTGLNLAPGAGDRFYVLPEITEARNLADQRMQSARQRDLVGGTREHVTLENLYVRLGQMDELQTLNIILRADVRGSIEAIRKELGKLAHPEVQIKILQATVGGITEADVHLADASDAVIIGFNVVPDEKARILAENRGVQIRRYDIIYQVTGDLKAALEGMLRPEKHEKELGRALVQQLFKISRVGTAAGCRVLAGSITRDCKVRVIRDNRVIGDYALDTLKREKDDAREVREGLECGIKLAGFNDIKEGDVFEAYKIEEVKRTFAESAATV
jgi:translation initiation factor IF-2